MESQTASQVDEHVKIQTAAHLLFSERSHQVSQLIGYRQHIAQLMLNGRSGDEAYATMKELLERVNDQIKQILAL